MPIYVIDQKYRKTENLQAALPICPAGIGIDGINIRGACCVVLDCAHLSSGDASAAESGCAESG